MRVGRIVESLPRNAYLCPLDNAGCLPELRFGPNRITRFTAAELEKLFDVPQLPRINPTWGSEPEILARYKWLVVETRLFEPEPWQRLLSKPGNSDWAEIEPHRLRVPGTVEEALFAILLAPWEDWVETDRGFWRPFDVPWARKVGDDPSVRRQPPISAATLSWDRSPEGEFVMPQVRLKDGVAAAISRWLNDSRWDEIARAQKSPLFKTPVKHFFVKAFLEVSLDEFLSHLLTIEAALGLESDYPRKGQPRPPKAKGATKLMAARVSALLGAENEGKKYCRLFNFRSTFLHGRTMGTIPGEARFAARQLARRIVHKLIEAASADSGLEARETYLHALAK